MRSPESDYRALRETAALLDLADWRAIRLYGADTRDFLQGMASQDLSAAGPGRAAETLFLTEKGRPVAHAWVTVADSGADAWIVADPASAEALRPHFERFRIMEDVELEGTGPFPRVVGAAGPARGSLLQTHASLAPGSITVEGALLSFLLLPEGAAAPAELASRDAVDAWRIAAGLPLAGVDFDLDRIATELNLPDAISFTKGCYVGQEVVARTSNRGQVRRQRVGFRFPWPEASAAPPKGTPILFEGAPSGFVTSAAPEPGTRDWLGMGYVATEHLDSEDPLVLSPALESGAGSSIRIAPWPL